MANEKTPVVWDDTTNKHRPLGTGEKMGGLDASSIISSDSGNLLEAGSDGLAYVSGSGIVDPRADNLLEESDRGRLQVTVDRIAEWLDGHPQDAALLADAINVVSGDEGNVIVQGTDKGAFLSKEAIGAALQGLTDAQKQALAAALASQLASQLADGHTIVAAGGKLKSDPTNATAAEKTAINQALADADSGLVVDPSTGKLGVDFSNMPTDKFEELLKGLKMKVPLSSNMNVYVSITNSAAGDDIVDGRGTQAKPFKHIQAAVNYVAQTYALGQFGVFIRVAAGTYPENVTLPAYDRGTGVISIVADSGARDVIVQAQPSGTGPVRTCFYCSGGVWNLQLIDARREEIPNMGNGGAEGCYVAFGDGAELILRGCAARQSMPSGTFGGNAYSVRLINADGGGVIRLFHGPSGIAGTISTQKSAIANTPKIDVLSIARGGSLWLACDDSPSTSRDVNCSGSCDCFLSMWQSGAVNTQGNGELIRFVDDGVTGQRFELTGGSHVAGLGGNQTYFPGDSSPSDAIEASTYCWYN